MNIYNRNVDRINNQIKELESLKQQYMQPMIQQNFMQPIFQNDFNAKWVDNIEQVRNMQIDRETICMNKNEPTFYLKEIDGEIKTYKFEEVIEIDEKDKKIQELEKRLNELEKKGSVEEDEQSNIQTKTKSKSTIDK